MTLVSLHCNHPPNRFLLPEKYISNPVKSFPKFRTFAFESGAVISYGDLENQTQLMYYSTQEVEGFFCGDCFFSFQCIHSMHQLLPIIIWI